MKKWINRNYKTIIILSFLIPIITVAVVSISHVTKWYGISNPMVWAMYLSIGVEIAALSALAALSADMGKKVYLPFIIVTIIQFIGNVFFAYDFINVTSESFLMWVDMVAPLIEYIGVDPTDMIGHRRFLALLEGGMLPVISLSFLHMLVKFTQQTKTDGPDEEKPNNDPILKLTDEELDAIEKVIKKATPKEKVDPSIKLSDEELDKIEKVLERTTPKEKDDGLPVNPRPYKEGEELSLEDQEYLKWKKKFKEEKLSKPQSTPSPTPSPSPLPEVVVEVSPTPYPSPTPSPSPEVVEPIIEPMIDVIQVEPPEPTPEPLKPAEETIESVTEQETPEQEVEKKK